MIDIKQMHHAFLYQLSVGLGEELTLKIFSKEECKILLNGQGTPTEKFLLFNSRLVSTLLRFSGKVDKDILGLLQMLDPAVTFGIYEKSLREVIIPFFIDENVLGVLDGEEFKG